MVNTITWWPLFSGFAHLPKKQKLTYDLYHLCCRGFLFTQPFLAKNKWKNANLIWMSACVFSKKRRWVSDSRSWQAQKFVFDCSSFEKKQTWEQKSVRARIKAAIFGKVFLLVVLWSHIDGKMGHCEWRLWRLLCHESGNFVAI